METIKGMEFGDVGDTEWMLMMFLKGLRSATKKYGRAFGNGQSAPDVMVARTPSTSPPPTPPGATHPGIKTPPLLAIDTFHFRAVERLDSERRSKYNFSLPIPTFSFSCYIRYEWYK